MVKTTILTADGLRQLEEELEYLKTEKRQEVAEKIKQARAYGDLSENSEYDEAKNEQAQVESRIMELEEKLKNIKIIDEENIDTTVVGLGVTVKVLDCEFDEEVEYTIVGSTESDPSKNRISDESPVGKALLGARVGETVEAQVPSGATLAFKVLDIRK